jgi:hypothetical protein
MRTRGAGERRGHEHQGALAMPSSAPPHSATVFYWPSGRAGGKGVGHVAVRLANGIYVSHYPAPVEPGEREQRQRVGTRTDVPGFAGTTLAIYRDASHRFRTHEDDLRVFGPTPQSLVLPPQFDEIAMAGFANGRMLASAPGEPLLHGPLPYYQLADSSTGAGDRSQCATTAARMIAAGVPLTHQHLARAILEKFDPDSLWRVLRAAAAELAGG